MSRRQNRTASPAQIAANRADAPYSTAPRSQEGKNKSRTNACRHKITAQVTVMTDPDREAHDKFVRAYIEDLAPEGFLENQLAHTVASDHWRMNRARAIEENAFSLGLDGPAGNLICEHPEIHSALSHARTFFYDSETFARLTLYEQRVARGFHRNLKLYRELKAEREANRKANPPAEIEKPLAMAAGAAASAPETAATAEQPRSEIDPQCASATLIDVNPPSRTETPRSIGFVLSTAPVAAKPACEDAQSVVKTAPAPRQIPKAA